MKKSLIAMAVAGLFAAPVAMAEVTISGAINLGINVGKTGAGTAGGSSLTTTQLNAHYSHIDIESVDDIGGGNKVIFHYQMQVNPESTAGNPFNRDSFLGIAGGWGAFKMGTNENVYERMMYTADPIDGALGPGGNLNILGTPGANTIFDAGQSGCGSGATGTTSGCAGFYRRTDQTIWYESPNWSGFSFEIDQTLSAFKTNGPPSLDPTVTSIGGKFQPEGAPFYVDLSYEKHKDMFGANAVGLVGGAVGGTDSSDTGVQIGVGYMIGDLGLHARFETLKYTTDGSTNGITSYKRDAEWIGVKYNLPSGYIGGEIGIAQNGKNNVATVNDSGAKMFAIGYFHNLSKQSQLQFIYGRTDNQANATYGQAGAPAVTPGADAQVFHVGLKHTF
jgi:predicted porin